MANVYINGKRIVPAPLYAISHDITRTNGGVIISCVYSISLTGSILANRGYPSSTGAFSTSTSDGLDLDESSSIRTQQQRFKSLLNKQLALKQEILLEGSGYGENRTVQIINTTGGPNGQTNDKIEFNYFTSNIEFEPSTTTDISNYTITLQANDVRLNNRSINPASGSFQDYYLRSASDTMSVQASNDYDNTYTVTRSVKAQGYKLYDSDVAGSTVGTSGWASARAWVKSQFGTDIRSAPTLGQTGEFPVITLPTSYEYVNATVSEDVDRLGGEYGITISWTYAPKNTSGVYYSSDDYTISHTKTNIGSKNLFKISGVVKGYQDNTRAKKAYEVAKLYFDESVNISANLSNRIANKLGVESSSIKGPVSSVITHNEFGGSINYDFDFYQRPTGLPAAFSDVDVTMSKNNNERIIAEIGIPGRTAGPIIQDIKTKQAKKRSVNASFLLGVSGYDFSIIEDLRSSGLTYLNDIKATPTGTENTHFWMTGFSHNLDISNGKYSIDANYTEL
jgi:hypothetical protein